MKRRYRPLALGLLLLSLLFLAGCQTEQDPAGFTAGLVAAASSGNDKALAAYKGKTYQMNVPVAAVIREEYAVIRCSDYVSIRVFLPSDELAGLQINDVIAVEGTVEDVEVKDFGGTYNVQMTVGSAHVVKTTFELTGKVEEIYHNWGKGVFARRMGELHGQDGAGRYARLHRRTANELLISQALLSPH